MSELQLRRQQTEIHFESPHRFSSSGQSLIDTGRHIQVMQEYRDTGRQRQTIVQLLLTLAVTETRTQTGVD